MYYRKPEETRLKELMDEYGVSIEELAVHIDATEGEILDWRNGVRTPSVRAVKQIADYLGCETDELLCMDTYRRSERIKVPQEKPRKNRLAGFVKFVLIAGAAFIAFVAIMANL